MADKTYIWKGPPTAIEVVSVPKKEGAAPEVHFEGMAVPGQPINKPLPGDHEQVKAWLAFGLIEEQPPLDGATAPDVSTKPNRKEPLNG